MCYITSLDWQRFKNKFEDVAKITRVEQLFEKNSSFYHCAEQSTMQYEEFETFSLLPTEIRCKDIMLKMSEQNDGEVDYVTNLQRRARTFLADLRTKSPLNFWLIQNLDIHPTNHHQLGSPVIPPPLINSRPTRKWIRNSWTSSILIESESDILCIPMHISLKKTKGPANTSVFQSSMTTEERTIKNATTE
jgi:hypothetical protein